MTKNENNGGYSIVIPTSNTMNNWEMEMTCPNGVPKEMYIEYLNRCLMSAFGRNIAK